MRVPIVQWARAVWKTLPVGPSTPPHPPRSGASSIMRSGARPSARKASMHDCCSGLRSKPPMQTEWAGMRLNHELGRRARSWGLVTNHKATNMGWIVGSDDGPTAAPPPCTPEARALATQSKCTSAAAGADATPENLADNTSMAAMSALPPPDSHSQAAHGGRPPRIGTLVVAAGPQANNTKIVQLDTPSATLPSAVTTTQHNSQGDGDTTIRCSAGGGRSVKPRQARAHVGGRWLAPPRAGLMLQNATVAGRTS